MSFVIDKFISENLKSTQIASMNINASTIKFKNLTIDNTLQPISEDAPNFDFSSAITNYDDIWVPKWTAQNKAFLLDQLENGAFLGSGKLGLITSFDHIDVQKTVLTVALQKGNRINESNVIEPFYVNAMKVFYTNIEDQLIYTNSQKLNMRNAIFESSYKIIDRIHGEFIHARMELFVPRHIPFTTMQSFTLSRKEEDNKLEKIMFYHEAYVKHNLKDVSFNNNTIHSVRPDGDNVSVYVLTGKGYTPAVSRHDPGREVAFATVYVIEDPKHITNVGFNVYRDNPSRCYNSFSVDFRDHDTDTLRDEVTLHVFSCMLTDHDYAHPLDEAKKIALTVYLGTTSPLASIHRIRSDHVVAWSKLWQTNVTITPKTGIPSDKEENVNVLNRLIRTSLYNLYAASREALNMDPNLNNMSVIDMTGSILNEGDIWMVPLMLLIKPVVARSILDYRFQTISLAQQLAGSYGFQGAKFPYIDSIGHVRDGVHWDVITPLSIFNTAMIAINTWNYYRVSKDKQWLDHRGYVILRNVAEFLVSIVEIDEEDQTYHIKNVMGMNGVESKKDNSFTNYLVKQALMSAIEASYELTLYVPDAWLNAFFGLGVLYVDVLKQIVKFDDLSIEEDTYRILEMYFILTPYFSKMFFQDNDQQTSYKNPETIKANLDYYSEKIKNKYRFHPFNIALEGILLGLYAQYDESYLPKYEEQVQKFIDSYVTGIWNHTTKFETRKIENGLNMNAIFLMIILQGMTEARIEGGVAETRFYYEELRIRLNNTMNMPTHWGNIRATHIGPEKTNYFVRNKALFIKNTN